MFVCLFDCLFVRLFILGFLNLFIPRQPCFESDFTEKPGRAKNTGYFGWWLLEPGMSKSRKHGCHTPHTKMLFHSIKCSNVTAATTTIAKVLATVLFFTKFPFSKEFKFWSKPHRFEYGARWNYFLSWCMSMHDMMWWTFLSPTVVSKQHHWRSIVGEKQVQAARAQHKLKYFGVCCLTDFYGYFTHYYVEICIAEIQRF